MPQSGAFKGEVVVCYFELLITQHMEASGTPFGWKMNFSIIQSHRPPAERVAWIFSAVGGKKQRHGSALIGAGVTVDARAKHPV